MIPDNPIGVIELGNLNLKCLIFRINKDGNFEVLSTAVTQSEGIHNGAVTNLTKASDTIRTCISTAEKNAEVAIKKINVIIEQPEFLCTKLSKDRKIGGSKIHKEDIEFLLKEAKKQVSLNDDRQSIIHIFNHNYIVDGKTFMDEPIDVYADYLSHEMTFITMPKNNIKNINQAFIDCDIEIERLISSTFALAVQLLNENDLKFGSILIDIGFEKTSLGLFKNLALLHSITFPIGINHIVKDISKVCSLKLNEAEKIMNKIDFSFQDNERLFDENGFLKKDYFSDSVFRKISKSLVLSVAKSRIDEIFEMIKKQINIIGLNSNLGANYFVAGGSNLYNLENYCSKFFESQVKKLQENDKENVQGNTFSSCLGALKIIVDGWETEAMPESQTKNTEKIGFFQKIFGIKF